jgi:transposase InsO family protein
MAKTQAADVHDGVQGGGSPARGVSERISREQALDALDRALVRRRPLHGLVHHADRGQPGRVQAVVATTQRRGLR